MKRTVNRFSGHLQFHDQAKSGLLVRFGMIFSAIFLFAISTWSFLVLSDIFRLIAIPLFLFGLVIVMVSRSRTLSVGRANILAISGHLVALLTFYIISSRVLDIVYSSDSIIASYMGVVKVLHLENPYVYSIKPFLDQFGLPPSYYTPRVDGSFEFHLNYPALNFLSMIPFYLLGLHDLRDVVLVYHTASILIVFAIVPSKFKTLSLIPFAFYFPIAITWSMTDSLWALLLLLSGVAWYTDRKRTSFILVGLAAASKQLALLVLPYLIIRNWHETGTFKVKNAIVSTIIAVCSFFLPNLPFIVASPSAWWAGVVAPYLPGSIPQVMGGIGFSEVLTSIGTGLPSSAFFLFMGLAFAGSLLAYAVWYQRLKSTVWLLPALVMFFYYRSFPNYLFYWVIPAIPSLAGSARDSLRFRPNIPKWHVPARIPRLLQGSMAPSFLLGLVLVAAFAGASGAYSSRNMGYRVSVHIDRLDDPDKLGLVTFMRVSLVNIGTVPVAPQFFVKWSIQPFLWTIQDGPSSLANGDSASYTLVPSDPVAAIPNKAEFRVWTYDSIGGNLIGQSPLTNVEIVTPIIVNPEFRWWSLDLSAGVKVPYGWRLHTSNADRVGSGIAWSNNTSSSGLLMMLNYTGQSVYPGLISLSQKVSGNLTVPDLTIMGERGNAALGSLVTDGTHLLYIVYSDHVSQETVRSYGDNTTVTIPLQSTTLTLSSVSVNLRELWLSQSWTVPVQFDLSFYLTAKQTGVYTARIYSLTQEIPVPQTHTQ